jgi:hypothetical protein
MMSANKGFHLVLEFESVLARLLLGAVTQGRLLNLDKINGHRECL